MSTENKGDVLYLDSDRSLVLPYFDTSLIANSDIETIVLSLYVLDKAPETPNKVQITINPIDLNNNSIGDGLSTFINVNKNEYVDFRLPKELFKQSIQIPRRFLVSLVSKNQKITLQGSDPTGMKPDVKLTVKHSESAQGSALNKLEITDKAYNVTIIG